MRTAVQLLFLACVAVSVGCKPATAETTPDPPPLIPEPGTEREEGYRNMAVEDPAESSSQRRVAKSGTSTDIGRAPGGQLTTSAGKTVELQGLLQGRGAVVVFYRGHWCKQCRVQLAELQERVEAFRGRGFEVYAVSTDKVELSAKLKATLGLEFELLSDPGGLATQGWGVYSREHDLARPSVFVVNARGDIVYRYVGETPSDRPTVDELLEVADRAIQPEPH